LPIPVLIHWSGRGKALLLVLILFAFNRTDLPPRPLRGCAKDAKKDDAPNVRRSSLIVRGDTGGCLDATAPVSPRDPLPLQRRSPLRARTTECRHTLVSLGVLGVLAVNL